MSSDVDLIAAYASGRADEREEWLPVLEALKEAAAYLTGSAPRNKDTDAAVAFRARAAIAHIEGKS